jgi:hypothetical protein
MAMTIKYSQRISSLTVTKTTGEAVQSITTMEMTVVITETIVDLKTRCMGVDSQLIGRL